MKIKRRQRPSVKVRGLKEARHAIRAAATFPETLEISINRIRRHFAQSVHRDIVSATPVRTGHLRASNRVKIIGTRVQFINLASYARFVDLGTGRRGAKGYMSILPPFDTDISYSLYWPGMEAQPFMRGPIAEGLRKVNREIANIAHVAFRPPR